MKPVALPPGRAKLTVRPVRPDRRRQQTRSARCGLPAATPSPPRRHGQNDVRRERRQFCRLSYEFRGRRVAARARCVLSSRCGRCSKPKSARSLLQECLDAGLKFRIVRGCRAGGCRCAARARLAARVPRVAMLPLHRWWRMNSRLRTPALPFPTRHRRACPGDLASASTECLYKRDGGAGQKPAHDEERVIRSPRRRARANVAGRSRPSEAAGGS